MNDFDGLLTTDFGFKPQGKSAPMAASKGSSNFTTSTSLNFDLPERSTRASSNSFAGDSSDSLFSNHKIREPSGSGDFADLFGASDRPAPKSERGSDAPFDLDSMFGGSNSRSVNLPPVYDKPVYDDDIFDGVPGIKSSSSKVVYDDVFRVDSGADGGAFDDLLGDFGKLERESKSSVGKGLDKEEKEKDVADFGDLLPGFGGSKSSSDRPTHDIGLSSEPTVNTSKTASSATDDPFKVFESASAPIDSTSAHFIDPLEEISKFSSSKSTKNRNSSYSNDGVYDDINPFDGLGKSVPAFSSEQNSQKDSSSPTPRSNTSANWTGDKESNEKSSVRSPERYSQNKIPVELDQEFPQASFDMPTYTSSDSHKPVRHRSASPSYENDGYRQANIQADVSPKYEENLESNDDIWLTVSEIPLFTQPTASPPPARPPPPRPVHIPKSGTTSSASTTSGKRDNDFSSFPSSTRFSQAPKSAPATAKLSPTSQIDELEDFATGRSRDNDDEHGNGLPDEELEMNSAAAAMKEAMDRAEAKFRHAKGVRERDSTKAARSKESVQPEKDDRAMLEERARQERLDHERQQKEREAKEQRRLEMEREKEREHQRLVREREKARQAVERATREARERAAAEARQRAERAAVEKANAEARARAERAAVQRAQAEARERAAAEAKERAEKAAAEAKEREARERAAAEARVKAERAAVERAAAEARERAAAEARERAAAAARMNQQKNQDDLESFFSMGSRANSAPRPPRTSSSDSVFDAQFQQDVTRKSTSISSSMKKASSSTNIVDDLSSIFGGPPSSGSGEFQDVEGESEERRRARLERHQRAHERAAKALAEKNQRDLETQREQAERHRLAETLDFEIKRWSAGKEGNLRALLSTLQYVLWPECGWQPVSLTDLITAAAVKKAYRKATLCIHPDKVQQKGATLQQKYIAEKVFDLLKEAWTKLNSEELF